MKKKIFDTGKLVFATILITVGVVGFFVPFFPDIIFILLGMKLLAEENRVLVIFKKMQRKILQKFQKNKKAYFSFGD